MSGLRAASSLALLAALTTLGCGSAGPPGTAGPPAAERSAPSAPGCGATCDQVNLRGPLAAAGLGADRVAVAARSADGGALLGIARVDGGRWDPRSLHLRPVSGAPDEVRALGMAAGGDGAVLALADAQHIALHRVDPDGQPSSLGAVDAPGASHLALAASPGRGPVALGWLDAEGLARVVVVDDEGNAEPAPVEMPPAAVDALAVGWTAGGLVAATAGPGGVRVRSDGAPVVVAEQAATDIGLAAGDGAVVVVWAADGTVRQATVTADAAPLPRTVDDGRREGDPAHRVGAALTVTGTPRGWIAAYQDQTDGALVVARSPGGGRSVEASPERTRGMHVALARMGDRVFVLDLGARSDPEVTMSPFVTPAALR